jgi:ribosomal protein L19
MELTREISKASQNAVQKPPIHSPSTNFPTSITIQVLITSENKPSVKIFTGIVMSTRRGRMIKLTSQSPIPATSMVETDDTVSLEKRIVPK